MAGERLTRDLDDAMLGGVMAGIARRWDFDVTLLRLLALVAIIPSGGLAVPAYLVAWLVIPRPDQVEDGTAAGPSLRDRLRRDQVESAAREAGDTARRAADRISDAVHLASEAARTAADAARAAADAARTAAEEISDIAHQPSHPESGVEGADDADPTTREDAFGASGNTPVDGTTSATPDAPEPPPDDEPRPWTT